MSGQQFNLRWNNHTNNLVQVFADQYEREQMVDVTLSCQGKFLKAHKMVLGACSPYFQDIFDRHDTTPHPIIIMNGFDFDDVQAVVEFMYKGEVMVSESVMPRMLKAAEGLQIKGLSNVRSKRDSSLHQPGVDDEVDEGRASPSTENVVNGSRRNSGSLSSELQSNMMNHDRQEKNGIPLHRRRKRARTASFETVDKNRKIGKQQQSVSPKSEPGDDSVNPHLPEEVDQDEQLDDLLTAINIEPPLLRDIDATVKTEWDSPLKDDNAGLAVEEKGIMIHDLEQKEKIPRPPNSFMIFANEWRRQLAGQFPNESNKEISVRLGLMWKNLSDDLKAKYFTAARQANDDHKKKYPDYHYNPKEARLRKMWKMQQQQLGHMVAASGHH